jgi:hypothetical protein
MKLASKSFQKESAQIGRAVLRDPYEQAADCLPGPHCLAQTQAFQKGIPERIIGIGQQTLHESQKMRSIYTEVTGEKQRSGRGIAFVRKLFKDDG